MKQVLRMADVAGVHLKVQWLLILGSADGTMRVGKCFECGTVSSLMVGSRLPLETEENCNNP